MKIKNLCLLKCFHFSKWFRSTFNIGFHIPKKDKCVPCTATKALEVKTEEEMNKLNEHIKEKEESNKRFLCHQDLNKADKSIICASFDMQKVVNTPHGDNMALYYSWKISVYNFTIFESNTQVWLWNIWNETDTHRGANEISTCLLNYIMEVEVNGAITPHYI